MVNQQLKLNQYIPCQLAELSNSIIRGVADLFEDWYNLSITEWKVIVTVARRPGLSAVDVAECAGLDTVAVSRAVTKLMDADRIERKFGREDRRRSILKLSEEGQALYEQVLPVALKLQSSLMEGLTDEERAVFEKVIRKLDDRSREFTHDIRHARQPQSMATRDVNHRQVPLRTNSLSLTAAGLGVMPRRRAI